MEVKNSIYESYDSMPAKQKNGIKLDDIYVEFLGAYVPIKNLYVITSTRRGVVSTKPLTSLEEFNKNLFRSRIARSSSGIPVLPDTTKLYAATFKIPEKHESTSIDKTGALDSEKVAYGLRRLLKVEELTSGTGYIYAKVNDEWKFIPNDADNIYWFDGTVKKTYADWLALSDDRKSSVTLFDKNNTEIESVYSEKEFHFTSVEAKESADFDKGEKVTYKVKSDGTIEVSSNKIDKNVSQQEFVKREVPDEKNPGKTKTISQIKIKNFQIDMTNGKYISVIVDGHTRMVHLDNAVDMFGNPISDMSHMVGEKIQIRENDKIVGTSEPLTYEQANQRYDTIKTYQEVDSKPTSKSYLRLENGKYIKELETLQPTAYKCVAATETNFDKYLLEQATISGEKKYVVVDKDYFEKHGDMPGYNKANAIKIKKCDFNDKNCSVVQTTSKNAAIEKCVAVGKITMGTEVLPTSDKSSVYSSFLTSYQNGEYELSGAYLNGDWLEFDGNRRYEYTDEYYETDFASKLKQYNCVNARNLEIKNGKMVGGVKFDIGKAIAEDYSNWGKALMVGLSASAVAGIFIPVVGPLIAAGYSAGMLAAIPGIPLVNLTRGLIQNGTLSRGVRSIIKFKDKTEYNRAKLEKEIKKEIQALYGKKGDLKQEQFNDAYSRIMNRITSFSKTGSNNTLVVKNGEAEVTADNANLANQYKHDYNKIANELKTIEKQLKSMVKKDGSVPKRHQKRYNELKDRKFVLEGKLEEMKNVTLGESYDADSRRETLTSKANQMWLAVYIEKNHDYFDTLLASDAAALALLSKVKYSVSKGLTIDGLSIDASEKKIDARADSAPWKRLRDKLNDEIASKVGGKEADTDSVSDRMKVDLELAKCVNLKTELEAELGVDPYTNFRVVNTFKTTLFDPIFAEVMVAYDAAKDATEFADVTANLAIIVAKFAELEAQKDEWADIKNKINLFEADYSATQELINEIEALKPFPDPDFEVRLDNLKALISDEAKNETDITEFANKVEENTNRKVEAEALLEDIKQAIIETSYEYLLEDIEALAEAAENKINDLPTPFVIVSIRETLSNQLNLINSLKTQVEEKVDDVDFAKEQHKKIKQIKLLVDICVDASTIIDEIHKKGILDKNHEMLNKYNTLIRYYNNTEATTLEQLDKKVDLAKKMLESIIALKPKAKVVGAARTARIAGAVETDLVRLNGERLVRDKINDLLTSDDFSDEDKHIYDRLLTATKLGDKELRKKLGAIHKKLSDNISKTVNTKLTKGYLPYTVVQTIADELHLDKKMFDVDPNQYSMF